MDVGSLMDEGDYRTETDYCLNSTVLTSTASHLQVAGDLTSLSEATGTQPGRHEGNCRSRLSH